jgi:molybdopterin synthase sulfur carrier subunit
MNQTETITVYVPSQLRDRCAGARRLELTASSVRVVLDELEQQYPSLYRGICDETGALRRHVNVFVNASNIRDREGLDTALVPGDEVMVLPAVSGG